MEIKGTGLKCQFCALAPLNSLPTASPCASVLSGEGGLPGVGRGSCWGADLHYCPTPSPGRQPFIKDGSSPMGCLPPVLFRSPGILLKSRFCFRRSKRTSKFFAGSKPRAVVLLRGCGPHFRYGRPAGSFFLMLVSFRLTGFPGSISYKITLFQILISQSAWNRSCDIHEFMRWVMPSPV